MVAFVNAFTGTEMWVADDRVEEYKAAGHVLAAHSNEEKPEEKPVKKTRKAKAK